MIDKKQEKLSDKFLKWLKCLTAFLKAFKVVLEFYL